MKNSTDDKPTQSINNSFNDFFKKLYEGNSSDIGEITYFTCLKILSETMGKMPCYIEKDDYTHEASHLARLLAIAPNHYMSSAEFFAYLERCRTHYGNAYAYISYDKSGNIEGLYPLDPLGMQIYINNTDKLTSIKAFYQYTDTRSGKSYAFVPDDLIHLKNWITDKTGYVGKSTREILASYMSGNKRSQEFLNDLYKNGMTANLAVKYVGDMAKEAQKAIIDKIRWVLQNSQTRVLPVPQTWELQPLDIKLADNQFLEIKKYSAGAIAAAFGLPPTFLNDYEKASYASSSAQNVSFYVNTLLYIITAYELELSRKLLSTKQLDDGYRIKFNFNVILRADPVQQASMLSTLVNSGIYTVNEARQKLGLTAVSSGNINVVNGSCKKIDTL